MSCPICLTNNTNYVTECNHNFCKECIQSWAKKNNSCPLCRKSLGFDKIYGKYNGCTVLEGNLNGFMPNIEKYLSQDKISNCVSNKHNLKINKPYGITIDCINCQNTFCFNY